jgi:hypothetical protein
MLHLGIYVSSEKAKTVTKWNKGDSYIANKAGLEIGLYQAKGQKELNANEERFPFQPNFD